MNNPLNFNVQTKNPVANFKKQSTPQVYREKDSVRSQNDFDPILNQTNTSMQNQSSVFPYITQIVENPVFLKNFSNNKQIQKQLSNSISQEIKDQAMSQLDEMIERRVQT